jgi:hypothetical protein
VQASPSIPAGVTRTLRRRCPLAPISTQEDRGNFQANS